jgi:hypothetical protein
MIAKVNALQELRPLFGRTLLPSVLACTVLSSDRAFTGEL